MSNLNNKKSFLMGIVVGVLIMSAAVAGYTAYMRQVRWGGGLDPNRKVMEIYSVLDRFSILPFDKAEMLESMYRGFLAGVGDPYTQYFDHEALAAFHTRTAGEYVGIGVRVMVDPADRTVTVVNVFRGAPSYEAGLLPGDKIVAVNGEDVVGRPLPEVVGLIQGPEGTSVNLTILRPYENLRFDTDVFRALIEVPTVFHEMFDIATEYAGYFRTGYIRIEGFDRPTLSQFSNALAELQVYGMDSLIIDVRNNPGGLLHVVEQIADLVVPEGIITFTEDVDGHREYLMAEYDYLGLPIVVLVNGRSASASELLAGAIQDTGAGVLVGTQTFGKGIVQNLRYLSDGTAIKLTVAKYFTPNGTSIHGIGLTPDFVVEMDESISRRIGDLEITEDAQLQAALKLIQAKLIQTSQNPAQ